MSRAAYHRYILVSLIFILAAFNSCTDPDAVFDKNTEISNRNWAYVNKIKYDVKIDDPSVAYKLSMNIRVTGDYKYANLFMLVKQSNTKGGKPWVTRYEFKLANADGEWLGQGTGNLYSYQVPFKTNYKFPEKGIYHFEIEQNMRDNPLHEVSDIGLRVEKTH